MEAGVDFIAADIPDANRMTLHIMAAPAEQRAQLASPPLPRLLLLSDENRSNLLA